MKKAFVIMLVVINLFLMSGCARGEQPGIVFGEEDRFVLIDSNHHDMGNRDIDIYADTETGVMYIYVTNGNMSGLSPLYNSDGSLFIYDKYVPVSK